MRKIYTIGVGILLANISFGQLDTVTRFNQVINDIQVFDNKLFVGGGFTQNEGQTCYWSAYYDGSVSRHTGLIGGTGIRELGVFDNDLYHVGTLSWGSSLGVGVWGGSTWTNAGGTNYSHSTMYVDGNTMYVESDDGIVRSRDVGGSWQPFYDFQGNGGLSFIIRYGNNLIFGGSFSDVGGTPASNIAAWDGSTWTSLGSGLDDGASCAYVYNNELYVAGEFTDAGGVTVDGIAKWDGTSWADVGGGFAGASFGHGIREMLEFNGNLYAVGRFDMIGGQVADDFAYWNGSAWTGINYPHPESSLTCLEIYNNELYMGSFDFNESRLYRYMGGVGVPENYTLQFNVAPNPSDGVYVIEIEASDVSYEVYDYMGAVIRSGNDVNIDISDAPVGTYLLKVKSGDESKTVAIQKL